MGLFNSAGYDADVLGIGFGPSNIALAIALEELYPDVTALFLEGRDTPGWQPGMLLSGSDIQHHPVRDLVTPRNPRSRYGFLNHLHEEGRLFDFLNLNIPYPLRKDYARYVTWVARQFDDQVRYGCAVTGVTALPGGAGVEATLADGRRFRARAAVVAPGRPRLVPAPFADLPDHRVFHYTRYAERLAELRAAGAPRIAVVGASQGAVEICLDLGQQFPDATVHNLVRGFGYRQKDLSPFHTEVYFPEFTDYYYAAAPAAKRELDRQLRHTNYSAADIDVLTAFHTRLYEQGLDGGNTLNLVRNSEITGVRATAEAITIDLAERHTGSTRSIEVDYVILATGFLDLTDESGPNFLPGLLADVRPLVGRTETGHAQVGRDYRLLARADVHLPPVYLNGLCETTHGLGDAGSFSLVSLRAAAIADSLSKALVATPE